MRLISDKLTVDKSQLSLPLLKIKLMTLNRLEKGAKFTFRPVYSLNGYEKSHVSVKAKSIKILTTAIQSYFENNQLTVVRKTFSNKLIIKDLPNKKHLSWFFKFLVVGLLTVLANLLILNRLFMEDWFILEDGPQRAYESVLKADLVGFVLLVMMTIHHLFKKWKR